jgi:DNA polymerase I
MDEKKEVFPFCYTSGELSKLKQILGDNLVKVKEFQEIELFDSLTHQWKTYFKVIVHEPGEIGGGEGIRDFFKPNVWQESEKFYMVYMKLKGWNYGMPYKLVDGKPVEMEVTPEWDDQMKEVLDQLRDKYKDHGIFDFYARFFDQNFPDLLTCAFDIEVWNGGKFFPDYNDPRFPVVTVSFVMSSGSKLCYVLRRDDMGEEEEIMGNTKVKYFDNERELLANVFQLIENLDVPIYLTFNGDEFDIPYMHYRARLFGLDSPFYLKRWYNRERGKWDITMARIHRHLHFDLFKWFKNKSLKDNVYRAIYEFNSLEQISQALVGIGKLGATDEHVGHSYEKEVKYCIRDSLLLIMLFNKTKNIIFFTMRLFNVSLEDISRRMISFWHINLLRRELHRRGWIEPNRRELNQVGESSTVSIIKGKKARGAIVKAIPDVYVWVTTLDFASLYPSLYQTRNISWETVNCECCSEEGDNRVPETSHWTCKKHKGLMGELYGFFKDIRVLYFKKMKISDVEQGLKVGINSAYGAFGFEKFPLFCIVVLDVTLALARYHTGKTSDEAENMGQSVFFNDTDSLGIPTQDSEIIEYLIRWAKEKFNLDLEVDKLIKLFLLSMKKNYVMFSNDGKIITKGLMGNKKNTPPLWKRCFNEILNMIEEEVIV